VEAKPDLAPQTPAAESAKSSWLSAFVNGGIVALIIAGIYWNLLHGKPILQALGALWNVGLVILGIGFLIFIHELGHFLAAKACDVRVETFSIGIGPTIPGCAFRFGETLYKLALFPIGGYVKMLGQTDPGEKEEDVDAAMNSGRSYINKPVWQRMVIISAGVVMNVIFGLLIFVYVYLVGKTEVAPYFGTIEPASPADLAGLRAGSEILRVNDNHHPNYEDLFYATALARPDVTEVDLAWRTPDGKEVEARVIPRRNRFDVKPLIGVGFPSGTLLDRGEEPGKSPAFAGTPAAAAPFLAGDRIVGIRKHGEAAFLPIRTGWDLVQRQYDLRRDVVDFLVQRKGQDVTVPGVNPAYFSTVGLRFEPGPIVAVSQPSQPPSARAIQKGDVIVALNGNADFDPLRLPDLIMDLVERNEPIELTLRRGDQQVVVKIDGNELKGRGTWNEMTLGRPTAPIGIPALGISYELSPTLRAVEPNSPAATAGIPSGATVKKVRVSYQSLGFSRTFEIGDRCHWPSIFFSLQGGDEHELEVTVVTSQGVESTFKLKPKTDTTWPFPDRGLKVERETRVRVADSVGQAMQLGLRDTWRFIGRIYLNLYSLVVGNISYELLSGPPQMFATAYRVVERGLNEYLMFLAIISINLAIVNFLPIPVLDGGHMVLLAAEKIRGKPLDERWLYYLTIAGLVFIVGLMLFVTLLDLSKMDWVRRWFPFLF
jgi:regulator of sigma E protease